MRNVDDKVRKLLDAKVRRRQAASHHIANLLQSNRSLPVASSQACRLICATASLCGLTVAVSEHGDFAQS